MVKPLKSVSTLADTFNLVSTTGAAADGISVNTVTANLIQNGQLSSGQTIVFSLSGNAKFPNGTQLISATTDVLGQAKANLTDTVAESVTITAVVANNNSLFASTVSQFSGENSNDVDKISLFMGVDGAKADGKDMNEVEVATRTLDGSSVSEVQVSLSIDNGAFFFDGSSRATIKTDVNGNASVPFSSTVAGDVMVRAYLPNNFAVYNTVNARFIPSSANIVPEVSILALSDGAVANGSAVNRVQVMVKDAVNGTPLQGVKFRLTVTGDAKFSETSVSTFDYSTDADGYAYAGVYDSTQENVNVSVSLKEYTGTANVELSFKSSFSKLEISSVMNDNRRFNMHEPSVAWPEATFSINAAGGSGKYSWSVNGAHPAGVQIYPVGSQGVSAIVHFSQNVGYGTYVITLEDTETKETLDYSFTLDTIFSSYGQYESIHLINLSGHSSELPSISELDNLYSQWGNMMTYPNWIHNKGWYWTNDFDITGLFASVYNLTTGDVAVIEDTLYNAGFAAIKL